MVALDISHERRRQQGAAAPDPAGAAMVRAPAKVGAVAGQSGGAVVPQSVKGRLRRIKWVFLAVSLAIYGLLPFLRWKFTGH